MSKHSFQSFNYKGYSIQTHVDDEIATERYPVRVQVVTPKRSINHFNTKLAAKQWITRMINNPKLAKEWEGQTESKRNKLR